MDCFTVRNSPHAAAIAEVVRTALAAVEPGAAVHRHVQRQGSRLSVGGQIYDLDAVDRTWVVGGGKAATAMAGALVPLLGEHLAGGLVVTRYGHADRGIDTGPIEVAEAGHPLPDAAGVAATERMTALVRQATGRDLVLAVLSGGASALLTLPAEGLALHHLILTTELLLRSGATISELNCVRKHLSQIKGGGLARLADPAPVVALVLSDVVGDPLEVIASGPTSPDPTTFADAWAVVERYRLARLLPQAVAARLRAGLEGAAAETLKPGESLFQRVQNVIVGSNRLAAEAAVESARRLGFHALLLSTFVEGEAREVGRVAAALAREAVTHGRPAARPACLVWGGETTVTVRGQGKGGRNQELALAAALALEDLPGVLLLALGTDGSDGPTDAAGAVASGQTVPRARGLSLDPRVYLANNDAYPFFDALGDLLRTGPTGTNVNDLLFIWVY
jgi:glycerate 2-kinase